MRYSEAAFFLFTEAGKCKNTFYILLGTLYIIQLTCYPQKSSDP
jgi:hypothetical protein